VNKYHRTSRTILHPRDAQVVSAGNDAKNDSDAKRLPTSWIWGCGDRIQVDDNPYWRCLRCPPFCPKKFSANTTSHAAKHLNTAHNIFESGKFKDESGSHQHTLEKRSWFSRFEDAATTLGQLFCLMPITFSAN
jgi:hypothetical protein